MWIGKYMERGDLGAHICTWGLSNTKQECYQLDSDVRCV